MVKFIARWCYILYMAHIKCASWLALMVPTVFVSHVFPQALLSTKTAQNVMILYWSQLRLCSQLCAVVAELY